MTYCTKVYFCEAYRSRWGELIENAFPCCLRRQRAGHAPLGRRSRPGRVPIPSDNSPCVHQMGGYSANAVHANCILETRPEFPVQAADVTRSGQTTAV